MLHDRCPYYFEQSKRLPGQREAIPLAYCEHKHSPARRTDVLGAAKGGQSVLTCGGDFARCQVPGRLRLDIRS